MFPACTRDGLKQEILPQTLRQSAISAMIRSMAILVILTSHPPSFAIGSMKPECQHPDPLPGADLRGG